MERFDDASRSVRGSLAFGAGSLISIEHRMPGIIKVAVMTNTKGHGTRSAMMRLTPPGIRPATRYALTKNEFPSPSSASGSNSRR